MIFGMREGMTDHEVVALGGTCGEPLACHTTFGTGRTATLRPFRPSGRNRFKRGNSLSHEPLLLGQQQLPLRMDCVFVS